MSGIERHASRDRATAAERTRGWALRAVLAWLAISAAFPGVWATVAPGSFYDDFPAGGTGWVAPLGPANGHFMADVGAFFLAFAFLFAWAAWRPDRALVTPLCLAWTGFSLLHLGWHAAHLAPFTAANAIAQTASLVAVLAAPLLGLWLSAPRPAARASRQPPAASQAA